MRRVRAAVTSSSCHQVMTACSLRSVMGRALFSDDTRAMHGLLSALGIKVEAAADAEICRYRAD